MIPRGADKIANDQCHHDWDAGPEGYTIIVGWQQYINGDSELKPKLVRCDGCNKSAHLKDGLCALCTIEANLVHDCPGEAVPSHKMEAEVDKEEVLGMLRALSREQYENEEQGKIIVAIYTMYRGWMLKLQKEEIWGIHATKAASPRVKEYCETVKIAAVIAQRVADRAKMLDLAEPQHRHITALKNAMGSLREAEYQLRIAGESR